MTMLKYRGNAKIAFVTLTVALMLSAEPVLAEKSSKKASSTSQGAVRLPGYGSALRRDEQRGDSGASSPKNQQASRPSFTLSDQRPSPAASLLRSKTAGTGKTLPIVTSPSRASTPSTRASSSRSSDLSSFSRTTSPSLSGSAKAYAGAGRLPSSIVNSRQSPGIIPSRPTTQTPIASGARESFSSYLGSRKPAAGSSSVGKQTFTSPGNRISSEITSRIDSLIGAREPSAPVAARPPTLSPSIRISPDRASRIGFQINAKENQPTAALRPQGTAEDGTRKLSTVSSDNPISSGETSLISSLNSIKQPAIDMVRQTHHPERSRGTEGRLVHDSRLNIDPIRNFKGDKPRPSETERGENTREKAKISNEVDSAREGERGSFEFLRRLRAIHKEPEKTAEDSRSSWLGIISAKGRAIGRQAHHTNGEQAEAGKEGSQISRRSKDINLRVGDGTLRDSNVEEVLPESRTTTTTATINTEEVNDADTGGRARAAGRLDHQTHGGRAHQPNGGQSRQRHGGQAFISHHERSGPSRVIYHDRPHLVKHTPHYHHVYRDWHNWLCYRPVWPRYRFCLYYSRGPCFTFRYFHPYYHRKYIFVSLGGYWPIGYRYARYYWYGCHPYYWYGYYPIAREVMTDTYNYYTYNYYGVDAPVLSAKAETGGESGQTIDNIGVVDHNTFADVREKLAQQAAEEPAEATLADSYFEDAVKAFEAADYDKAIEMFANASKVAPDDIILPFAHSQALFAKEQYSQAVEVLRAALTKISPEKEGAPPKEEQEVFYPRGLYPDNDTLFEQIDRLAEKAELYSFDADLQLLLGYQLLGIGQTDEALEPLLLASKDMKNADAAAILLRLLEKIKAQDSEGENTD